MKRTELIRELIDNTGLNVKAFSEKAGVKYTTLRSMLERGIGNASVDNVIKVCKALGITVEELDDMARNGNILTENKPTTIAAHFDGEELTEEEQEQLDDYIKFLLSRRK